MFKCCALQIFVQFVHLLIVCACAIIIYSDMGAHNYIK